MPYKGRAPFQSAAFTETQRNFTYFDKSLTSGLTDVVISSPGDFLYIDQASTGVVQIELNMRQGGTLAPITLAAGGSIECDFASFKLTATAQLNKSVRIIVGNGARIKGGANVNADSMSVNVVDGGLSRSLAGIAFCGYGDAAGAVATNAHVQFWNPAASTKYCYVEKVFATTYSAQSVTLTRNSTALGSSHGATRITNKSIGGAVGSADLRYHAVAGLVTDGSLGSIQLPAGGIASFIFAEPVLVPPGYGLVCSASTVNTGLVANFEWYEK